MEPAGNLAPSLPSPLPAVRRRDPSVRRQLSGPALRAFFTIARAWQLSPVEERALLGWPPTSTFHKYKGGDHGTLGFDALTRLSLILGIFKSLQVLYPDLPFADRWMRLPNSHPLFAGRSPIDCAVDGDIDTLFQIRRLLDGRRG